MPTTAPIDNVMGVLGLPLAFAATSLGIGLLIERVLGAKLANALLIPLGACGSIVVSLGIYWTGLGDVPAVVLTVALTFAGAALARGGLRARLRIGWPGLAGLGAYLLFVAPELFSGHWTWSGYNFLNDTATQFALSSYLKAHGLNAAALSPQQSTTAAFIQSYLATSYPVGAQAQLATLSGLLDAGPAVLYQGYLAALAGMTAMSLSTLCDGYLSARMAALGGFIAAGAALTYQYALQGSIKEIGTLATCVTAVAIARHVLRTGIDVRGALLAAVPLAALMDVYYSAALPFVGAVAIVAVVAAFLLRRSWPDRRMVISLLLALAATGALAAPASSSLANSYTVASATFGSGSAAGGSLGQLARPLPLIEASGVWLGGDYRYAIIAEPARELTGLAAVLVFALALPGAGLAVRAGEIGPAVLLASMLLMLVVVLPKVTPYAGAKALAIASPAAVLAAFIGATALARASRRRSGGARLLGVLGPAAAACIGIAVVASDAVAYNYDNVAPTSRILAVEQVGRRFAGRGLVLWNEFEEYAKYFAQPAQINAPFEAITPRQVALLQPTNIYGAYFDLDQEKLSFVDSFPTIVMRRSPSASRPPANYSLAYVNSYYEAWVRRPTPRVLRHLPSQQVYSAAVPVGCASVHGLVMGAPRGTELIAAVAPFVSSFDPVAVLHPADWPVDGVHPDAITLVGSGAVAGKVLLPRDDRYELWVQGSFPRAMSVVLDGRRVGSVQGVNTPDQWFSAGQFQLTTGPHYLVVSRGSDGLAPGDAGAAYMGPVAVVEQQPERLETVPVSRWRSLCRRTLDWIELAKP